MKPTLLKYGILLLLLMSAATITAARFAVTDKKSSAVTLENLSVEKEVLNDGYGVRIWFQLKEHGAGSVAFSDSGRRFFHKSYQSKGVMDWDEISEFQYKRVDGVSGVLMINVKGISNAMPLFHKGHIGIISSETWTLISHRYKDHFSFNVIG